MNNAYEVINPDLAEDPQEWTYRPRKPWLAALMSLMLPGFGQLYNGQFNRGTWFFIIFVLFALPIVTLAALYVPASWMMKVLLLGVAGGILVWLASIIDAYRCAKKQQNYLCRPWQKGSTYLSVYVLCSFIGLPTASEFVRHKQVQSFKAVSGSMKPTLLGGDYFFADMRYNCANCAKEVVRGDMAVFIYPNNRNRIYVKRIVALPGDEVIYNGADKLVVNGAALSNPASVIDTEQLDVDDDKAALENSNAVSSDSIGDTVLIVPPREVFVMGDNWARSSDSRNFGTVPLSDIKGLVRQIWFSKGEEGVRWDRIGLNLLNR